jgi:hypothetical protein
MKNSIDFAIVKVIASIFRRPSTGQINSDQVYSLGKSSLSSLFLINGLIALPNIELRLSSARCHDMTRTACNKDASIVQDCSEGEEVASGRIGRVRDPNVKSRPEPSIPSLSHTLMNVTGVCYMYCLAIATMVSVVFSGLDNADPTPSLIPPQLFSSNQKLAPNAIAKLRPILLEKLFVNLDKNKLQVVLPDLNQLISLASNYGFRVGDTAVFSSDPKVGARVSMS